ncbi:hypothetical protein OHA18_14890 [Kribbella sp. NBC_00709]|uniref:hypothetical protein n=1 Tax=Kribbella sp. NBC_00709 TaxID=2975972 RepID=UPI002E2B9C9E|nr:hypothetical protein [Kribbella sp. NBC_00709]
MQDGSLLDAREEETYRLLVGLSAARAAELAEVVELAEHRDDRYAGGLSTRPGAHHCRPCDMAQPRQPRHHQGHDCAHATPPARRVMGL